MSGGLKIRTGWRATNSSDQIFRGIDVTASMPVFQTGRVGAAPTCRTTFSNSSVADTERHLSCKQVYVSANLTGGSIPFQHSLHSVTAAFFVVNEAAPGQNRLREPFQFVRKTKSRVSGPQNRITQCKSGARVHHFIGYERASCSRLVWDQDTPGAAPGYPTTFIGL